MRPLEALLQTLYMQAQIRIVGYLKVLLEMKENGE